MGFWGSLLDCAQEVLLRSPSLNLNCFCVIFRKFFSEAISPASWIIGHIGHVGIMLWPIHLQDKFIRIVRNKMCFFLDQKKFLAPLKVFLLAMIG